MALLCVLPLFALSLDWAFARLDLGVGVEPRYFLWLRLAVLLLVGWAIPGLLLARRWRLPFVGLPGYFLAAWGLGFCWLLAGALLAHYLPGPLLDWQLWAVYGVGGLALAWRLPGLDVEPLPRRIWWAGAVLLVAGALLRLPGLGYHEFHTDEVVLVRQASLSIDGALTALAEHTKGPGEIAVTLAVYRALGAIDEGTARFPFALMSVGSILAAGWLGFRMFAQDHTLNRRLWIGLWAGVLLMSNGFAIGLSRIAQYQAGVILLSALAVWAMWEFAQTGKARWLSLAGVFSAFGMVLHYEFGLLAPALLLLAFLGIRRSRSAPQGWGHIWRTALWTALTGGVLLAVAYVPPLFNPYFATTQTYLSNRLGETFVFNVPFFVEMGTFYNSTYFFFCLTGLMLLGAGMGLGRGKGKNVLPTLALCVWWLAFFVLYIFVVRYPGTHFYQMMTAWSLLAAVPLAALADTIWMRLGRRSASPAPTHTGENEPAARPSLPSWLPSWLLFLLGGVVLIWLAVSVFYLYLLFFRQDPEYLVNHEREGLAFYWAPYAVPQKPRFGFPIHAGWHTIGVLGEWNYLQGTYSSNDRSWGLRTWYRAHLTWIEDTTGPDVPDYVLTAAHIQEENLLYHDGYHQTHHRVGEVRFRGEPRIELWAREPLPVPYVTFDAEDFEGLFLDQFARLHPAAGVNGRLPAQGQIAIQPGEPHLDDELTLARAYIPGATWQLDTKAHLTLVWEPHRVPRHDYKLFVHVADAEGRPLAQWDGYPGLNTARTSTWPVGEPFFDHVLLPLPPDLPAGEYTLLVGLYEPESGARLGDRAIQIAHITVR